MAEEKSEPTKYKLDCTKITTLEEVKLILQGLGLNIDARFAEFHKLKHLIKDPEK